jgi:hypothetical protein
VTSSELIEKVKEILILQDLIDLSASIHLSNGLSNNKLLYPSLDGVSTFKMKGISMTGATIIFLS